MKFKLILFFKIFLIAVILFSCNKKTDSNNKMVREEALDSVKQPINKPITLKDLINNLQVNYPIEKKIFYDIKYNTNILENDVDVRIYPSMDAEILGHLQEDNIVRILGFTKDKTNIDDFNGYWVNILYSSTGEYPFLNGWVFSKYVDIGDIEASPIKFAGFSGNEMVISYEIQGEEIFQSIYSPDELIIVWDTGEPGYHYSSVPGVYLLNLDTLELTHITYFGAFEGPIGWTTFLDDKKYLVQDTGTDPVSRGLTVWNLIDNKKIFEGGYHNNWLINNHTIEYVRYYNTWALDHGHLDEELIAYGQYFKENKTIPPRIEDGVKWGLIMEIVIRCSMDLETGERKILGGDFILTQ
jgi:hypothetical protein